MTAFSGITNDLYALPPRGVSVSQTRIGDELRLQWTYLCEQEGCLAVAYSRKSADSAREQVAGHSCPAPLRRGILPMGKSLIEKTWDTADEAMDAYKADGYYLDEGCTGDKLKYYIMALAEVLTFFSSPHFRITEDVLRELNRRWKMRQGLIPFSPTPGYRFHPMPAPYRPLRDKDETEVTTSTQRAIPKRTRKAVGKPASTVKQEPVRQFNSDEVAFLYASLYGDEMIPIAELAAMFGVSEDRIKTVAGPKRIGPNVDLFASIPLT